MSNIKEYKWNKTPNFNDIHAAIKDYFETPKHKPQDPKYIIMHPSDAAKYKKLLQLEYGYASQIIDFRNLKLMQDKNTQKGCFFLF